MELFLQACAGVLLAAVLTLVLRGDRKEIGILLTLAVGCMVLTIAIRYLEPVMDLMDQLEAVSGLDPELVGILLKATGIGLVGQIAELVCQDTGNSALGKEIQVLTTAVILWQSIPLFRGLLELVQSILGEL